MSRFAVSAVATGKRVKKMINLPGRKVSFSLSFDKVLLGVSQRKEKAMKIKAFVTAIVVLALVFVSAGNARAFGFGPASFGLGALGSAIGFAASGDPRAAAIGGAAGFVAGSLLTPPYYYRAPAPMPPARYYPAPPPPVVYYAPVPAPAPNYYYAPPPPANRYYRPVPPGARYCPAPYCIR